MTLWCLLVFMSPSRFQVTAWDITYVKDGSLLYMKIPQTRRRWTPSSTFRSLAVAPPSVTWWWVLETIISVFVDLTNFALQLFRLWTMWTSSSFNYTLPQVSVTQQYETNTVSNKKKRTLHHIGFAVYEVPPNMTRLSPQYVLEHVSQNLFFF